MNSPLPCPNGNDDGRQITERRLMTALRKNGGLYRRLSQAMTLVREYEEKMDNKGLLLGPRCDISYHHLVSSDVEMDMVTSSDEEILSDSEKRKKEELEEKLRTRRTKLNREAARTFGKMTIGNQNLAEMEVGEFTTSDDEKTPIGETKQHPKKKEPTEAQAAKLLEQMMKSPPALARKKRLEKSKRLETVEIVDLNDVVSKAKSVRDQRGGEKLAALTAEMEKTPVAPIVKPPEKRKRGRPRKVAPESVIPTSFSHDDSVNSETDNGNKALRKTVGVSSSSRNVASVVESNEKAASDQTKVATVTQEALHVLSEDLDLSSDDESPVKQKPKGKRQVKLKVNDTRRSLRSSKANIEQKEVEESSMKEHTEMSILNEESSYLSKDLDVSSSDEDDSPNNVAKRKRDPSLLAKASPSFVSKAASFLSSTSEDSSSSGSSSESEAVSDVGSEVLIQKAKLLFHLPNLSPLPPSPVCTRSLREESPGFDAKFSNRRLGDVFSPKQTLVSSEQADLPMDNSALMEIEEKNPNYSRQVTTSFEIHCSDESMDHVDVLKNKTSGERLDNQTQLLSSPSADGGSTTASMNDSNSKVFQPIDFVVLNNYVASEDEELRDVKMIETNLAGHLAEINVEAMEADADSRPGNANSRSCDEILPPVEDKPAFACISAAKRRDECKIRDEISQTSYDSAELPSLNLLEKNRTEMSRSEDHLDTRDNSTSATSSGVLMSAPSIVSGLMEIREETVESSFVDVAEVTEMLAMEVDEDETKGSCVVGEWAVFAKSVAQIEEVSVASTPDLIRQFAEPSSGNQSPSPATSTYDEGARSNDTGSNVPLLLAATSEESANVRSSDGLSVAEPCPEAARSEEVPLLAAASKSTEHEAACASEGLNKDFEDTASFIPTDDQCDDNAVIGIDGVRYRKVPSVKQARRSRVAPKIVETAVTAEIERTPKDHESDQGSVSRQSPQAVERKTTPRRGRKRTSQEAKMAAPEVLGRRHSMRTRNQSQSAEAEVTSEQTDRDSVAPCSEIHESPRRSTRRSTRSRMDSATSIVPEAEKADQDPGLPQIVSNPDALNCPDSPESIIISPRRRAKCQRIESDEDEDLILKMASTTEEERSSAPSGPLTRSNIKSIKNTTCSNLDGSKKSQAESGLVGMSRTSTCVARTDDIGREDEKVSLLEQKRTDKEKEVNTGRKSGHRRRTRSSTRAASPIIAAAERKCTTICKDEKLASKESAETETIVGEAEKINSDLVTTEKIDEGVSKKKNSPRRVTRASYQTPKSGEIVGTSDSDAGKAEIELTLALNSKTKRQSELTIASERKKLAKTQAKSIDEGNISSSEVASRQGRHKERCTVIDNSGSAGCGTRSRPIEMKLENKSEDGEKSSDDVVKLAVTGCRSRQTRTQIEILRGVKMKSAKAKPLSIDVHSLRETVRQRAGVSEPPDKGGKKEVSSEENKVPGAAMTAREKALQIMRKIQAEKEKENSVRGANVPCIKTGRRVCAPQKVSENVKKNDSVAEYKDEGETDGNKRIRRDKVKLDKMTDVKMAEDEKFVRAAENWVKAVQRKKNLPESVSDMMTAMSEDRQLVDHNCSELAGVTLPVVTAAGTGSVTEQTCVEVAEKLDTDRGKSLVELVGDKCLPKHKETADSVEQVYIAHAVSEVGNESKRMEIELGNVVEEEMKSVINQASLKAEEVDVSMDTTGLDQVQATDTTVVGLVRTSDKGGVSERIKLVDYDSDTSSCDSCKFPVDRDESLVVDHVTDGPVVHRLASRPNRLDVLNSSYDETERRRSVYVPDLISGLSQSVIDVIRGANYDVILSPTSPVPGTSRDVISPITPLSPMLIQPAAAPLSPLPPSPITVGDLPESRSPVPSALTPLPPTPILQQSTTLTQETPRSALRRSRKNLSHSFESEQEASDLPENDMDFTPLEEIDQSRFLSPLMTSSFVMSSTPNSFLPGTTEEVGALPMTGPRDAMSVDAMTTSASQNQSSGGSYQEELVLVMPNMSDSDTEDTDLMTSPARDVTPADPAKRLFSGVVAAPSAVEFQTKTTEVESDVARTGDVPVEDEDEDEHEDEHIDVISNSSTRGAKKQKNRRRKEEMPGPSQVEILQKQAKDSLADYNKQVKVVGNSLNLLRKVFCRVDEHVTLMYNAITGGDVTVTSEVLAERICVFILKDETRSNMLEKVSKLEVNSKYHLPVQNDVSKPWVTIIELKIAHLLNRLRPLMPDCYACVKKKLWSYVHHDRRVNDAQMATMCRLYTSLCYEDRSTLSARTMVYSLLYTMSRTHHVRPLAFVGVAATWPLVLQKQRGNFPYGFVQVVDILELVVISSINKSRTALEPESDTDTDTDTEVKVKAKAKTKTNFKKKENADEIAERKQKIKEYDQMKSILCTLCLWSEEKVAKQTAENLVRRLIQQYQSLLSAENCDADSLLETDLCLGLLCAYHGFSWTKTSVIDTEIWMKVKEFANSRSENRREQLLPLLIHLLSRVGELSLLAAKSESQLVVQIMLKLTDIIFSNQTEPLSLQASAVSCLLTIAPYSPAIVSNLLKSWKGWQSCDLPTKVSDEYKTFKRVFENLLTKAEVKTEKSS